MIHHASQPILGVCGGQQQIALAYGARVDLIERIAPGEGYEGALRERGYCSVDLQSVERNLRRVARNNYRLGITL